ncbi:unnamed protein product [Closterium sp. NIES-64]|nr:unnamed protein product [Closterium sp. NIES-64]
MPRKRSSKVTAEVTLPDDLLSDPITTPAPVVDGAEKQGSNDAVTVNAVTDNAAQSVKESATTTAADVAGGSGLSVEEKFQDNQAPIAVLDEFLEDDEDEELEIDIAKEDAFPASLRTSALVTPILKDPSIALVSTGSNREEWICTQVCCGKAKGKTFLAAADHIISSTHLLNQEKMGTATKASMDKAALAGLKKDYSF